MVHLTRLIQNELMKTFLRTRTSVFFMILLITGFFMAFFCLFLESMSGMKEDVWGFFLTNTFLLSVVELFALIIAADTVSSEYAWGTFTYLCIRPVSRLKILLSKYASVLFFLLVSVMVLAVTSVLYGWVFFGMPVQEDSMSLLMRALVIYGCKWVEMFMMVTLAFAISTLSKSNSLSIGLTLFLHFTGSFWAQLLSVFDFQWGKYLLFANLDLRIYFFGGIPMFEGMTLSFSLVILAGYYVFFLFLAWWGFTRREMIRT